MAKLSPFQLLRSQFKSFPPPTKRDLAGKTVVVVGANSGIGFEAAKHFAKMGPGKLVLACRDAGRGQAALAAIKKDTGFENVELRTVDLAQFDSVAEFATKFEQQEKRLDILMYNAGIATRDYVTTKDGWETTLQVNDLSCALMSLLLLPLMLKTASTFSTRPRLVIVASEVHFWADVSDEEFASPKMLHKANDEAYARTRNGMPKRYPYSKLINVLHARELTARLPPASPLIVNSVNPGFCTSGLRRNQPLLVRAAIWPIEKIVARTAEQGSRHLVWAATGGTENGKEDELRGAYVSDLAVQESSDFVLSKRGAEAQKRIWDETVEILAEKYPRVKTIVEEHLVSK